jgi:hypothetical protein
MKLKIELFRKYVQKSLVQLKSDKNEGNLYEDLCTLIIIAHRIIHKTRNVWDKICNENKHILYSKIFFRKSYCLGDSVEKYGRERQATDDNIKNGAFALHAE